MKMTPGLVGEKAPQVLCSLMELADLKIGDSYSSNDVFQMQKLKSCTVKRRSS